MELKQARKKRIYLCKFLNKILRFSIEVINFFFERHIILYFLNMYIQTYCYNVNQHYKQVTVFSY